MELESMIRDAEGARDELRAALLGVGVVLPTLRLDAASVAGEDPRPLVELGRCAPDVARQLAAVLRRCAMHSTYERNRQGAGSAP
ncbi:hypothetical protein OG422_13375 [Streptomyces sp. NBC_01525]|uniref:Uncharacterized protein n=2 Tax=Streptomyces TaxID=1883 RepID=A0A553ZA18_9ACTN|nr:hypothetical protein [Streptomyces benahoarensis]TSB19972.1 hypothetical protein FNJ62_21610 [Streptomyces benahoarensis]TSB38279.1 hypothetical protein FNZ23_17310 [Streptomyces benahoarensis]